MLSEHHFSSKRSFRYFTHGDPAKAHTLLYVLHGYGQLAQFFIGKFSKLDDGYFIVAPEGMHRFYLKGSSGRVGASWMTSEDRESDINDNLNWLTELDNSLKRVKPGTRKIILGFSQGGATAARWYYANKIKADHLIIWASVFPPDLPKELVIELCKKQSNIFALGSGDEYYNSEQQEEIIQFYKSMGFDTVHYEGNHTIDFETLVEILRRLN